MTFVSQRSAAETKAEAAAPARRKRVHQQHDRSDERHGNERADDKAEDAVELQFAEPMAYDRRHEQDADERRQQRGRPNDERPGQRKINRGDGDKSQYRLPARFRLVNMAFVCLHVPRL